VTWLGRVLVAWALLLSALAPAQARHPRPVERPGGEAGDFDYYLLSLSIAPSFCTLSGATQAKQECRSLTQAAFQQTPLTVHGLWPNHVRVSVNRQPHDCRGAAFGPLPEEVEASLQRFMPGGPGLQRHEWQKHGACSGLSPEAYFTEIVRLAMFANDSIGAVMRRQGMLGHSMMIADLLDGVGASDPALASAIVVDCRQPRGGGEGLVDEVRIVLSKDFQPVSADSVGLGQNSGCAGGRGLVPDVVR